MKFAIDREVMRSSVRWLGLLTAIVSAISNLEQVNWQTIAVAIGSATAGWATRFGMGEGSAATAAVDSFPK